MGFAEGIALDIDTLLDSYQTQRPRLACGQSRMNMGGDFTERCKPDIAARPCVLDELLERPNARGTPGDEGVAGEYEEAVIVDQSVQLKSPQLKRFSRRLDHRSNVGFGQKRVLLPVVEHPVEWQFGQKSLTSVEQIGTIVVHQARIKLEPVFREKGRSALSELPPGRPESAR